VDRILSNKNRAKESMKMAFERPHPPILLSINVERENKGER
jgi:hypothetical protein